MNKENSYTTPTISVTGMGSFLGSRLGCSFSKTQTENAEFSQSRINNQEKLFHIKNESIQQENNQLRSQVSSYETLNKSLQRKCESLQKQLEEVTGVLEETQSMLKQVGSNRKPDDSQFKREKTLLENTLKEQEKQVIAMEIYSNNLANESKAQNEKITTLEQQVKSQLSEIQTLRHQVLLAQKDTQLSRESHSQYENQISQLNEQVNNLQSQLKDKTAHLNKFQQRISDVENLREDNSYLQTENERLRSQLNELMLENQRIAKFQQQKIVQLEKDMQQDKASAQNEIQSKDQIISELEQKLSQEQDNEEYRALKMFYSEWESEKQSYQDKINQLTDDVEKISLQQYDQIRVQVEGQIMMKCAQERINLENHVWQLSSQMQDYKNQIESHMVRNSQLNVEIDQLNEQLQKRSVNSKQIILMEGQLRNLQVELEKIKYMNVQKSQELEVNRQRVIQAEGRLYYIPELERRVYQLSQENERLNKIIIDRCKSAW